jgi:rubredoxin
MAYTSAWKKDPGDESLMSDYKKYECVICGFIYDEAEGLPDDGIAAGTRWEDIPEDWECPDCGISKADFDLFEE